MQQFKERVAANLPVGLLDPEASQHMYEEMTNQLTRVQSQQGKRWVAVLAQFSSQVLTTGLILCPAGPPAPKHGRMHSAS